MKELQRDIYKSLIKWKENRSGKVLELSGARQVGKTYILTKFGKENYKNFIYINMAQTSGKDFMKCLDTAEEWEPGQKRIEKPLHKAFALFHEEFTDSEDTLVVIDEIQESSRVFSMIRQFSREFQAHFIVTGSYLGKTLEPGYFMPAGDVEMLTMQPLSFEEFLGAFDRRELYKTVDLYGHSEHKDYDELKSFYELYCRIGGYPAVVNEYLDKQDISACEGILDWLIQIFISESERYFDSILEINLLEQLLPAVAQTMLKEKKGSKDLITDLSKIVFKEESNRISKKSINHSLAWLFHSHIVRYCGMVVEGNILDAVQNVRFYFNDLGICRYFLDRAGANPGDIAGIINENFVYLYLEQYVGQRRIAGVQPMFATYKEGELDFFVNSRVDFCNYGIEVKAGKTEGKTANRMLEDKKVDYVYFMKGNTYGGIAEEKKYTIPIYLMGRVKFNIEEKES